MLRRLEEEDFRLPEMAQLRMLLNVSSTEWTYQDLMQVHDARILSSSTAVQKSMRFTPLAGKLRMELKEKVLGLARATAASSRTTAVEQALAEVKQLTKEWHDASYRSSVAKVVGTQRARDSCDMWPMWRWVVVGRLRHRRRYVRLLLSQVNRYTVHQSPCPCLEQRVCRLRWTRQCIWPLCPLHMASQHCA